MGLTLRHTGRLVKRELAALLGERTYVLMVLVQLLMVCSALFFAVGYSVIFSSLTGQSHVFPEQTLAIGFYTTDYYNEILDVLSARKELRVIKMPSEAVSLEAVRDGTLVGAVIVRDEYRRAYQRGDRMRIFWVTEPGNLLGAYASRSVADVLAEYGQTIGRDRAGKQGLVYDPILVAELEDSTNVKPKAIYPNPALGSGGVMQGAFEITYTLVIPLLLLFSLMIATSVVMDSITEELEGGTLTNVLVSPVSTHAIVLGKTMPIIILTLFQILVWTAILRLQGIMVENVSVVFLYLVLVLLVFTGMGVVAAAVTKRRRSSHALYSLFLLVFVYFTFVGGSYAEYSPANVITAIISNPVVLPAVWGRITLMAALAVIVYGGSFTVFRRSVIN